MTFRSSKVNILGQRSRQALIFGSILVRMLQGAVLCAVVVDVTTSVGVFVEFSSDIECRVICMTAELAASTEQTVYDARTRCLHSFYFS